MKRLGSVGLALVMLCGCGTVAVSADSTAQDYTRKMDAALIEKLNDPEADQVDVCIFLKNAIHSEAEVERIISERYTWTTQQEHLMCWRKVVSEIVGAYVQQFIEDHADLLDEVLWYSDGAEMIEATVSKENVTRLAQLDTVSNMYLYTETIEEPDIEEPDSAGSAESGKLLPDLQKAMTEKAPDDVIGVYISYKVPVVTVADMPSWPDIYAARKEYFAYSDQMQAEIQAEIFEGIDVQVAFQGVHNMVLARVKASDIMKIASYEIVRDIDYYDDTNDEPFIETEPTIEEMIVDAANELYHPQTPFPAEDIVMEFSYPFKDSSAYAVRFIVKDVEYVSIELAEHIGDWLLYSGYLPQPYIFADNQLYTVKEAYEGGILSEAQMQELSEAARALHSEFGLTRYIKGDADGDGEVSVIDATVIQRHEASIAAGAFYRPLADVDGDSEVSIIDATLIQRHEAGLYTIV